MAKRRLVSRMKSAMIPEEFTNARFDTFRKDELFQVKMYEWMKRYLEGFMERFNAKEGKNSFGFLAGVGESRIRETKDPKERAKLKKAHNSFGIGKTHLQIAAAKWILKQGVDVLCVSDEAFMDELSQTAAQDDKTAHNELIKRACEASVLVWDDLGKAKPTDARNGYRYRIIDYRYRHRLDIIWSSNEDVDTLVERIGDAAASRLIGMTKDFLYAVEGKDQR